MTSDNDDVWSFRHADGRWVQLQTSLRRIDRLAGVKAVGQSHVYTVFKNPEAMRTARSEMRHAIHREGFRRVAKLGRYKPVPAEAWRDAASLVKKKKSVLKAPPRNALEKRVALLEGTPGVVLSYKVGKPVDTKAVAAAEKQLGRPLPPSLRAFLAEHDGLLVMWTHQAEGWRAIFEIWPLRAMLKELKFRGDHIQHGKGILLPISPTYGREVIAALIPPRGEAAIVEWTDPPDGKPAKLAPDFAAYLEKVVKTYFVQSTAHDVSHKQLPAMRKVFGR